MHKYQGGDGIAWLYRTSNRYQWHRIFGAFLVIVCLITWVMELYGLVGVCPYCQTQRTLLGILGILLIIDSITLHFLISIFLIILGIDVACAQIFLHIKTGSFPNGMYTLLAWGSAYLFLIVSLFIIARVIAKLSKKAQHE
ncbi:hypothetical protein [Fangia hongkongensis]|uniref:hypothetical protein n=1 Tax=Fangia hongkongensis TaxID=270495 RepID=UPI000382A442|nr:hypothetical protein [Fangia hongkongensis]MBK2126092.1 hypothetical protein [Fangia hongkongensis]